MASSMNGMEAEDIFDESLPFSPPGNGVKFWHCADERLTCPAQAPCQALI
jgi:hypothetical protein